MSKIAKEGNDAEEMLATCPTVKRHLERYFGRSISQIVVVTGRKKTDLRVVFEDGTSTRIQNKNGHNSRGHHIHREDIAAFPCNDAFRQLFRSVCLKSGEPRCVVETDDAIVAYCLLGTEEEFMPDYITHTAIKDNTIVSLYICPMTTVLDLLKQTTYRELQAKETQVYINPFVVIKRRGGSKTDPRPDDIQIQLKIHDMVSMRLFKVLFQGSNERIDDIDNDTVPQVE